MVSSTTGDIHLPPPCRKVEGEGGSGLGTFYSADDHRRDVELRSCFFGEEIVAVTPTRLPPSRKSVMEWCKQRLREMEEEVRVGEDQGGKDRVEGCGDGKMEEEDRVGEDQGGKDRVEGCGDGKMEEEIEHGVGQMGSSVVYNGKDKQLVDDARAHGCTTTAMVAPEQGDLSLSTETPIVAKRCDNVGLGQDTSDQLASNVCCPFSPHMDEGGSGGGEHSEGVESEQTVMASGTDQSVEEEVVAKNEGAEQGEMGVASGVHRPAARLRKERPKVGCWWGGGGPKGGFWG